MAPAYAETTQAAGTATGAEVTNGASALAMITGAAIAIERFIEMLWTILGTAGLNSYWPLSSISTHVGRLTNDLTTAMVPFQATATQTLQTLEDGLTTAKTRLDEARNMLQNASPEQQPTARAAVEQAQTEHTKRAADLELGQLVDGITQLSQLRPTSQNRQLLAAAASQKINYLKAKFTDSVIPDLDQKVKVAEATIDGLQSFLATFKDNPGRRLISLVAGALIGVGAAWLLKLNLFEALAVKSAVNANLQVAMTGLVIGFGANPTHEVIRAIQEYKKSSKGGNTSSPGQPSNPKPTVR